MTRLREAALSGAAWSVLDKLVNQLGHFIVLIYLARTLGPEAFGLVGMLSIFMVVSQSLAAGGLMQALVQRSQQVTEEDASTAFYINLCASLALYVILYLAAPWIARFYQEELLTQLARVLFLVLILDALSVVVRARLTIRLDFRSQAMANLLGMLVAATAAITAARSGFGYWSLVIMTLLNALVVTASLWWLDRWYPQWIFSVTSFRRLFGFGSRLMLANAVAQFVNHLHLLLVGRYFSTTDVGYLSQSRNLTLALSSVIAGSLHGVTYPVLTSVKDDRERMIRIYKDVVQVTMLIALPVLTGLAVVADSFVRVFLGEEWLAAVRLIAILCFARAVTPISVVNLNILNVIGRSDLYLKVDISKLPLTLGAVLIAAPLGIEAVAWAMLVVSVASFFINTYYPGKLLGYGALDQIRSAWKIMFSTAMMFGVTSLVSLDNPAMELISRVVVGVVVYCLMLSILRVSIFRRSLTLLVERLSGYKGHG